MFHIQDAAKTLVYFFVSTLLLLFLVNLQTTIWYHFFGYLPAPHFWIPLFVYMGMYKSYSVSFVWLIITFLVLSSYTVALSIPLFFTLLLVHFFILFMQKRFSMMSLSDFLLITGLSSLLLPLIYLSLSSLSPYPSPFAIGDWLLSAVLTLPVSPLLLLLFKTINTAIPIDSYKEIQIKI